MCPPLTTKNWIYYVPQVAVGTTSGMVYVVSLKAEAVVQEVAVHTCPVRSVRVYLHRTLILVMCAAKHNTLPHNLTQP